MKLILTKEIQRKLKTSARKKKWNTSEILHNDTFTINLKDGCTVNVNFREPLKLT
ncbi:MAG TPA: hypothetical protein VL854_01205 [Nitrososphaeraceae archaeon]|nr:hypothetical protein [Nitrososphaeraceae archaeon]